MFYSHTNDDSITSTETEHELCNWYVTEIFYLIYFLHPCLSIQSVKLVFWCRNTEIIANWTKCNNWSVFQLSLILYSCNARDLFCHYSLILTISIIVHEQCLQNLKPKNQETWLMSKLVASSYHVNFIRGWLHKGWSTDRVQSTLD